MPQRLKKISGGVEKTASMIVLVLVFAFILYLTVYSLFETSYLSTDDPSGERIIYYNDNAFLSIILLTILLLAGYLFYRRCDPINPRTMEKVLLAWTFLFGTAYIATTKLRAPVFSDSFIVTYGAQRAALGDYAMLEENYFYRFPFQLGYVLYSEIFFRIVNIALRGEPEGYAVLALQEVNLFWLLAEFHALIAVTGLLFKDARIRRLLMLMLFFCLQPILTTPYLYGNIPAFSCGTIAVWMFLRHIKKRSFRSGLLCAAFLTLGVTLKLNLLILCVAVGIVWCVMLLKKPSRRSLLCLLLAAACVLTIPKLPKKLDEHRVGVQYGKGIPMIAWMAMGFSYGDTAATAENARKVLADRLFVFKTDPALARSFFGEKLRSQWNEPSYGSVWLNQVFPSYSMKGMLYVVLCGVGAKWTLDVMNVYQQFVFFCLLLGLIRLTKKKDLLRCLLPLILLGGLLYHLLFEAKSQYALPYFVMILPIAAYGLFTLYRKVMILPIAAYGLFTLYRKVEFR